MFDIQKAMPENTQKVFEEISKLPLISYWTLVGGTALALHLNHRFSEDLDLFINTKNLSNDLSFRT